ncbi:conserved hypothetical protein [Burkholderia pseudomallei Pakistan 9]|uniref:Uncharacterized protein n=2 Tax=Burkholderia pseudomallei TaxID=28450 RepID=A0A0E1W0J6_BURPE|nr:hypothetical protein BURPS1106A_2450 [Burkholderia pseudomallei 1106a]ACQ95165.1 conserved hypothetical protein [Burkholderia pseudomallei MSHR346]EEH23851.1 conserved hypothetical protein [Burkholderia pseudomallei Pakistan 9]EET06740.1 hypothetical protein BURPS1710A_2952 [Burkholderia pseudomallei 1710a]VUD49508.1 unnamed protein product [Burkholderia pseudomallei]
MRARSHVTAEHDPTSPESASASSNPKVRRGVRESVARRCSIGRPLFCEISRLI